MAAKLKGRDAVAVAFLGEGAANQGAFHESLNLAAVWGAPVVFVIEDNRYGISVSKTDCTAVARNSDRAAAYNMPGAFVEGNDPDAVHAAAGEAITRARSGGGPSLIEIETVRLEGHFMGDAQGYRPKDEMDALMSNDPIPRYRKALEADGVATETLDLAETEANEAVAAAIAFARSAAEPVLADAYTHVFVERAQP